MSTTTEPRADGDIERSFALVMQGREGRIDGVLTIVEGLAIAMDMAKELRERGTAVTVMGWTPPA